VPFTFKHPAKKQEDQKPPNAVKEGKGIFYTIHSPKLFLSAEYIKATLPLPDLSLQHPLYDLPMIWLEKKG
jgi:hypothetical protein